MHCTISIMLIGFNQYKSHPMAISQYTAHIDQHISNTIHHHHHAMIILSLMFTVFSCPVHNQDKNGSDCSAQSANLVCFFYLSQTFFGTFKIIYAVWSCHIHLCYHHHNHVCNITSIKSYFAHKAIAGLASLLCGRSHPQIGRLLLHILVATVENPIVVFFCLWLCLPQLLL